jgi:hypothetical protein
VHSAFESLFARALMFAMKMPTVDARVARLRFVLVKSSAATISFAGNGA